VEDGGCQGRVIVPYLLYLSEQSVLFGINRMHVKLIVWIIRVY